jgi:ATP adenylyltransferase
LFSLYVPEVNAMMALVTGARALIQKKDQSVSGFNIGMSNGESSGQTVFHCHLHLIPRRVGDMENPRGGVRNVIPGKGAY